VSITLDQLPVGGCGTVAEVRGGKGLRGNLQRMGIHVGDPLCVVGRGAFHGPLLVEIHGSRVALGRGVARRVVLSDGASIQPSNDRGRRTGRWRHHGR